jgi:hypothetical protein
VATLRSIVTHLGDPAVRFLSYLSAHPDTNLESAVVIRELQVERHRDLTRTVAAIGERLAAAGISRPWTEAQRGFSLDSRMASIVRMAVEG